MAELNISTVTIPLSRYNALITKEVKLEIIANMANGCRDYVSVKDMECVIGDKFKNKELMSNEVKIVE